jgi:hypothetical protein
MDILAMTGSNGSVKTVQQAFDRIGLQADVSERCDGMVKAVVSGNEIAQVFESDSNRLHAWINTMPDLFFTSIVIRGDTYAIYWSEDD